MFLTPFISFLFILCFSAITYIICLSLILIDIASLIWKTSSVNA